MFLTCIRSFHNQFRGGVAVNVKVNFILYLFVEQSCWGRVTAIVNSCGVNVGQFLIESSLTQPNLTNLCKQMFKVVFSDEGSIFHPLFIHNIATNCELSQNTCAPLTKLCGSDRIDTVAYRNNRIKIVKFRHIHFTIRRSCRDFLGN